MKISQLIITILLIGAIVIGIYGFAIDYSEKYDVTINSSYKTAYDKIDNITSNIAQMENETKSITPEKDKSFFTGVWDVFRISKDYVLGTGKATWGSITVSNDLLKIFVNDTNMAGENNFAYRVILGILGILVIGAFFYLLLGKEL